MSNYMIEADTRTEYEVQEFAIIVSALAFVIAVGGVAVAAIIICGWRGAHSVILDWMHGRATFNCR
jgi:hypothetical protein